MGLECRYRTQIPRRSTDAALAAEWANHLYLNRSFDWVAQFEASISKVTAAQVHQAFKEYIDPSKLVIVTAGDFH